MSACEVMSAPQLIWHAAGQPAPCGKTGSRYRFEAAAGHCATCATPIINGVPFTPRRGVAGIDNPTFHGYAEYARWGTHVCAACAWLYGDPKRSHRSALALGDRLWWPMLGPAQPDRPRWRTLLGEIARADPATPLAGVITVDPKVRLWPRMQLATAGAPALYVHSTEHDWSRHTPCNLHGVARAMEMVCTVIAAGGSRRSAWRGLASSPVLTDALGVRRTIELDEALEPLRGTPELLIACLAA